MAESSKGKPLKSSTRKLKEVAKGDDTGPNYLRASSGSCHDFCKYGTPHEFKAKPKRFVRRRSTPNGEITVEIFVPSEKRDAKAVKPSSVAPDPLKSTKIDASDAKSLSPDSSILAKQTESTTTDDVKPSPHGSSISAKQESSSNSARQESSSGNKPSQPGSSISAKQQVSTTMGDVKPSRHGSSISAKQESSSNSARQESLLESAEQESSLGKKHLRHDSSISTKPNSSSNSLRQESSLESAERKSSLGKKPLQPDSSISAKPKSSSVVKASSPHSSILAKKKSPPAVKQESSSDVKSSSYSFMKKASLPQINSSNASKSISQDLQSRRRSSISGITGSVQESSSKESKSVRAPRPPRLASGSIGKAPTIGRRFSLPNDKTTNLDTMKSKPNRASTEQSSSSKLLLRKASHEIKTEKGAYKKNTGSSPATLSRDNRKKNLKMVETSLTSPATIALTPNLPGTKVARLNVSKERIGVTESTSEELNQNPAPEKTLHMIEQAPLPGNDNETDIVQSQCQSSPASTDSLCQSKSPFSSQEAVDTNESESEYYETEAEEDANTVSNSTEGTESGAVKLKFRRGKVVDLQSGTNTPKKLRFRRRKTLRKDQIKDEGVKVVLRHQDLQERKTEQGLFNLVIEETASKLAETRKSKVKALVGAFETVISLQESRSTGEKLSPYSSPGR